MSAIRITVLFLFITFLNGCNSQQASTAGKHQHKTAEILEERFLDCFEPKLKDDSDDKLWCETSAVFLDNGKLYFANDKNMPDNRTSVFYIDYRDKTSPGEKKVNYVYSPVLKQGVKFEDSAVTPDGKYIFLTTAFNLNKDSKKSEWEKNNMLFYWPAGQIEKAKIISESGAENNSVFLRKHFSEILKNEEFPDGVPYFKIEGLSADDHKLYFGIREFGKSKKKFQYTVKIISVGYKTKDEILTLNNDFQLVADIDLKELYPEIDNDLGISSIAYNKYEHNFYILTSFETKNTHGAYLWTADLDELKSGQLYPVFNNSGDIFQFSHKAEGLNLLDHNRLIVIYDDDDFHTHIGEEKRKPHQTGYSILKIRSKEK